MTTLASQKAQNRQILYHKDGLLDIFIGFGILLAGLFLWTGMVWMAAIFIPIFLPSFQASRKRFLQSRLGNLDRDPNRLSQVEKALFLGTFLVGLLLLVVTGAFFALGTGSGSIRDWLRLYFPLAFGIIIAGVWIFAGSMLKINRFYLYGVLSFASFCAAQYAGIPLWLTLLIPGGLILLVGLFFFIRFLKQNPVAA